MKCNTLRWIGFQSTDAPDKVLVSFETLIKCVFYLSDFTITGIGWYPTNEVYVFAVGATAVVKRKQISIRCSKCGKQSVSIETFLREHTCRV